MPAVRSPARPFISPAAYLRGRTMEREARPVESKPQNSHVVASHLERVLGKGHEIVELEGRPGSLGLVHTDPRFEDAERLAQKRKDLLSVLRDKGFTLSHGGTHEGMPVTRVGIDLEASRAKQRIAAFAIKRYKLNVAKRFNVPSTSQVQMRRVG